MLGNHEQLPAVYLIDLASLDKRVEEMTRNESGQSGFKNSSGHFSLQITLHFGREGHKRREKPQKLDIYNSHGFILLVSHERDSLSEQETSQKTCCGQVGVSMVTGLSGTAHTLTGQSIELQDTYMRICELFFTNQPMATDSLLVSAQLMTHSRCLAHLTCRTQAVCAL